MGDKIKINNASIFVSNILCIIIFQAIPLIGLAQSYKSLVQKGNEFYDNKSYAEAQTYYAEALKKKDNDLEVVVKLGECLWRCNKMYEANNVFSSVANARNLPSSFYLYYGQSLRASGNYREAKNMFLKYSQINQSIGDNFVEACDWAMKNGNKSDDYVVINAGFNSKEADFSPVSVQGAIIFSSSRNAKIQNYKAENSSAQKVSLPQPVSFQGVNNSLAQISFSSNQSFIAYSQWTVKKNSRLIPESGLKSKIKWGNFQLENNTYSINELPFSINQGLANYGYPYLSNDGNSLYFSSDMEGGYGGMDLYVIYREGSNWTTPINLGPKINSQGDEISPFLKGKSLFFSSNWHTGFGGYDIFNVNLNDNNEWSAINNMGLPINSPFDDFDFMTLHNGGFFTSNRTGGLGAEDIYSFKKSSAGIVLKVVNALDGAPIPEVRIEWGNCMSSYKPPMLTNIIGFYNLNESINIPCTLTFLKEGFSSKKITLTQANIDAEEITIPLIRLGEIYLGQIFDNQTKLPLDEVEVVIENLSNDTKMNAQSSSNGVFEFALKPNTSYNLTLKKEGYKNYSKIIKTTIDGRDRTILGESFLTKGSNNASPDIKEGLNKGLSIQISALTSTPPANQFSDLWRIADIYVKREDNQVKIRMGVFKTQNEVLIALERVRQNGYPQAFIVEETNGPGFTNLVPVEMVEIDKPIEINKPRTPAEVQNGNMVEIPTATTTVKYKIQLAALRDTRFFDAKRVAHLGTIQDYQKPNNITAKVIGDFSEDNVKQMLSEIRLAGFKDAYIVKEVNGVLIPVPALK
jgi:tetratricopeptide (TPR) repeat protein